MAAAWDIRAINAYRPYVQNFLRTGDPTKVDGGTPVPLTKPIEFVEAYNKLLGFFPKRLELDKLGLLTALIAECGDKLRAHVLPTLDNGGQRVGYVVARGQPYDIDKGAHGAAYFADYAAQRGLWAGGASGGTSGRVGQLAVSDAGAALQTRCVDVNQYATALQPSWAEILAMYNGSGVMGEIRTPADFAQLPVGEPTRVVYLPKQGVIRWASEATMVQVFGGAMHDLISRGDELRDKEAREGYITRFANDTLHVQ